MRLTELFSEQPYPRGSAARRDNQRIAINTLLVLAATIVGAAHVPGPLFLPALSVLLLVCGFAIVLYAFIRREAQEVPTLTHWDQAGFLLFVGFAASMLSDPGEMIAYFDALGKWVHSGSRN